MISWRDSLASSWPATSRKVTPVFFSTYTLALALPTPPMPPMPPLPPMPRNRNIMAATMMTMGSRW